MKPEKYPKKFSNPGCFPPFGSIIPYLPIPVIHIVVAVHPAFSSQSFVKRFQTFVRCCRCFYRSRRQYSSNEGLNDDDDDDFDFPIPDNILEEFKGYQPKYNYGNCTFSEHCKYLVNLFSEDPNIFEGTDKKYTCNICHKKFGTIQLEPCKDLSMCRLCLVKHFKKKGSITAEGLKCPRCQVPVTWLRRGFVADEILNPSSGTHPDAVLPYTFFLRHHDLKCRIYGCTGKNCSVQLKSCSKK